MHPLDTSPAEPGLQSANSPAKRRRRIRHRVHTPAYACLNPTAMQPLDLCEIVDINEAGMAIQGFSPLKVGSEERFSLDLPETGAFVETSGQVIWSEASGRTGIRFLEIADEAASTLQQWLLANALAGVAEARATVTRDANAEDVTEAAADSDAGSDSDYDAPTYADYTAILSGLAAVKREVESLGADLDAILQLVARRSLTFTQAAGAAIALSENQDMVCRASAGDAPPLGTHLQTGVGFSGECVRTGALLRCDDSETDPRVDRESSRSLGIRSMIAVPIRRGVSVVGLLEVFSHEPSNFESSDESVLQRLSVLVTEAMDHAARHQEGAAKQTLPASDDEFPVETPDDLPLPQLSRSRNIVLIGAALTVVSVIAWLISTWDSNNRNTPIPHSSAAQASPEQLPTTAALPPNGIDALRKLADQGDADAQFAVGIRYATGEEVPADFVEAVRWFTKAAEGGNVAAQGTLGTYYWAGRGVPPDAIKAYFWSLVAQANGDTASKDRAAVVASRLTRGQVSAVQQQAREWARQHPPAQNSSAAQ